MSSKPRPGFKVELMAAEPLVQDPIAFDWGADGKLWVVEMGDYPLGVDGKGKPGGVVKFLEDTDGDGQYDKATVFLDGLGFPTGVMPWRKGVLVTCAPDIFYAEDTDGDGKADKREVALHRLRRGQPAAPGQRPGLGPRQLDLRRQRRQRRHDQVGRRPARRSTSAAATSASGPTTGDSRPRPARRSSAAAATTGATGSAATTRNPCGTSSSTITTCAATRTSPPPDRACTSRSRPAPRRSIPSAGRCRGSTTRSAANHFTSACSPIVYRDDLFGPDFAGNTFVSEPVHNLVHREVLDADGRDVHAASAPPTSRRREFLPRPTTGSGRR